MTIRLRSMKSNRVYPKTGQTYFYKIVDVTYDGVRKSHGPVSVVYWPADAPVVHTFVLEDNYPNPFNSGTTISFLVPDKQTVAIRIDDLQGCLVRDFPEFLYNPGRNKLYWHARDSAGRPVASGLYIYQVSSRQFKGQKKMLVLR